MVCMVSDEIDSEEEAKMWTCFSEVYQEEVRAWTSLINQALASKSATFIFIIS